MKKTVVIVDDHILFAQSLLGLIHSFKNFVVTGVFKTGKEFIESLLKGKPAPDIVLLDVRMPVMNGIDTMRWLKEHRPNQKTLALTMEDDEETIIKMIKLGCRGYLLKDIEPEEFVKALETVYDTGYYFNEETTEALSHEIRKKSVGELSSREKEFLHLACSERTYKEVAQEMNLSPKTIDGYREGLFHKLDVKSRVGLVLFAIKHGIVRL